MSSAENAVMLDGRDSPVLWPQRQLPPFIHLPRLSKLGASSLAFHLPLKI